MGTTTVTTCGTTNVFQETQRKKPYLKKCPVEDLCFCWLQFAPYFSESLNTGQLLQSRPLKLPPSFRRQVRSLASPHRRRSGTHRTSRRSVTKSRFRSSDKPVRPSTRIPVRLLTNRCAPSSTVRSRSLTQRQSAAARFLNDSANRSPTPRHSRFIAET